MPEYTGEQLQQMRDQGSTYPDIAEATGMHEEAVRAKIRRHKQQLKYKPRLDPSTYPEYNAPLRMEGDAAILSDFEAPFHHADFCNRVFDLCAAWKIEQAIFAGDVVHFDIFSSHGPAWAAPKPINSITEDKERELREWAQSLPPELQGQALEKINSLTDTPMEDEIGEAARALRTVAQVFNRVDYVLGNHDARFLKALEAPLAPAKLLDFLKIGDDPKWRVAPMYWSLLESAGELWQIEHPYSAAENTALKLADKFERNVIAGHSHLLSMRFSSSGKYYAIMAGHCCDERRMPYASARHNNRAAHALGAVIVRGGVPWLLHERVDWKRLERMK